MFSLFSLYSSLLSLKATVPPQLTGEPDAAQRRSVVPVHPGHRRLHGRRHSFVIQQQQAAAVRHVDFTQQVPTGRTDAQTPRQKQITAYIGGRSMRSTFLPGLHPHHRTGSSSLGTSVNKGPCLPESRAGATCWTLMEVGAHLAPNTGQHELVVNTASEKTKDQLLNFFHQKEGKVRLL